MLDRPEGKVCKWLSATLKTSSAYTPYVVFGQITVHNPMLAHSGTNVMIYLLNTRLPVRIEGEQAAIIRRP